MSSIELEPDLEGQDSRNNGFCKGSNPCEPVMSATGLEVFDKTLQTSDEIGPDKQLSWHVLEAALRAVRDQLPVDLAGHLRSQPAVVGPRPPITTSSSL
jgi:hypothetical protein